MYNDAIIYFLRYATAVVTSNACTRVAVMPIMPIFSSANERVLTEGQTTRAVLKIHCEVRLKFVHCQKE